MPDIPDVVLESQPAGYWPLDEPSGAADASGNGHHGTYKREVT